MRVPNMARGGVKVIRTGQNIIVEGKTVIINYINGK